MIHLTPENVHDYPVGTKVMTNYGAYHCPVEGYVIGHEIVLGNNLFPDCARLIVREENGNTNTVTTLGDLEKDKGIGTYLLEKAPVRKNPKSPWSD